MQASAEAAPVGYDLTRVEAWIAANIADLTPPLFNLAFDADEITLAQVL